MRKSQSFNSLTHKKKKATKRQSDTTFFAKSAESAKRAKCLVLKYVDTKKGVVMDKRLKKFTIADRLAILHEYETSDLTGAEIARKYGLNSGSTIRLGYSDALPQRACPRYRSARG